MSITSQAQIGTSLTTVLPFMINSAYNHASSYYPYPAFPLFEPAVTGYPPAFGFGTSGTSGTVINGTTNTNGGAFPYVNPTSGNMYISQVKLNISIGVTTVVLFDFLWWLSGLSVTTTTAQTINSVTLPARDANGTTNGVGVIVYLLIGTETTNTGAVSGITISYTNSNGVAGKTGTTTMPILAGGMAAGTLIPFSLAAGDVGVQSIQSITLGTSLVTGTIYLLMIREISYLGVPLNSTYTYDWAQLGFPQLYNGTALSFYNYLVSNVAVNNSFSGTINLVNG